MSHENVFANTKDKIKRRKGRSLNFSVPLTLLENNTVHQTPNISPKSTAKLKDFLYYDFEKSPHPLATYTCYIELRLQHCLEL